MKKKLQTALLALAAALICAAGAFASGGASVVSLSYLNGTYLTQLTASLSRAADGLQTVYDSALAQLGQQAGQTVPDPSWTSTDAFQSLYLRSGETVTLSAGSGMVWYSGAGASTSTLLDITAGAELPAGGSLSVGHRYLAELETVVTATVSSSCGAEGLWKTTATGTPPVPSVFSDVPADAWYLDAVNYVTQQGLFTGVTSTTFEPETTMSRAMLVTVLHRIALLPQTAAVNPFRDVVENEWYTNGVIWASQAGIVNGTSDTTFEPNSGVTREQIAVLLYRFSAYYGYDVSARASLTGFSDSQQVSEFAQEELSWAVAEGLMVGSDGRLNPTGSASRAEVATLLQRYQTRFSR